VGLSMAERKAVTKQMVARYAPFDSPTGPPHEQPRPNVSNRRCSIGSTNCQARPVRRDQGLWMCPRSLEVRPRVCYAAW